MFPTPEISSACIEMLFREHPDPADRIKAAAAAGYGAVEFWLWSNKDIASIETALATAGITLRGFCAEPMVSLTDPANHGAFLAGLPASIAVAQRLRAPFLYIQGGRNRAGIDRSEQAANLVTVLTKAAPLLAGSGVTLLLEPVSDGTEGFLTLAAEGLAIVAEVNRPEVRLLYDLYHAAVAGEALEVIQGRLDLVGHVHLADYPGRGAPGTGRLDLRGAGTWLRGQGYQGLFGLEYNS